MTTFIPLTDASAQVLVKNLKSKIIACRPTINSSQIETILEQWIQASAEASKAAAFIETARQKTQETLIRIAADKLSPSEERLSQFLRRAVTVKMLRKAHLEIAQTELRTQVAVRRAEAAVGRSKQLAKALKQHEWLLYEARAATARASAARRIEARASRASARAVEARIVEAMVRCDVNVPLKKAEEKGRYNTDLAIEKARKANALYHTARVEHGNGGYCCRINSLNTAERLASDKALSLSILIAMNSLDEKLKNERTEAPSYNMGLIYVLSYCAILKNVTTLLMRLLKERGIMKETSKIYVIGGGDF
jgi:hypothetical protein